MLPISGGLLMQQIAELKLAYHPERVLQLGTSPSETRDRHTGGITSE